MPQPKSSSSRTRKPAAASKPAAKPAAARKPAAKSAAAKPAAKRTAASKPAARRSAASKPAAKRPAAKPAAAAAKAGGIEEAVLANLTALRDTLRKGVVLTADGVKATLDDAVKRGRITRKDATELSQTLLSAGRRRPTASAPDLEQLLGRGRSQAPAVQRPRPARGRSRAPARRASGPPSRSRCTTS